MKPIVVDSDILIEISRNRNSSVLELWADLVESDQPILISPVSIAEIWHGARAGEIQATKELFDSLTCLTISKETGEIAGQLLSKYRKSHGIAISDAFIAAATVQHQAVLWTRNRKHYPMPELSFY